MDRNKKYSIDIDFSDELETNEMILVRLKTFLSSVVLENLISTKTLDLIKEKNLLEEQTIPVKIITIIVYDYIKENNLYPIVNGVYNKKGPYIIDEKLATLLQYGIDDEPVTFANFQKIISRLKVN